MPIRSGAGRQPGSPTCGVTLLLSGTGRLERAIRYAVSYPAGARHIYFQRRGHGRGLRAAGGGRGLSWGERKATPAGGRPPPGAARVGPARGREGLVDLYRQMVLVRMFEES